MRAWLSVVRPMSSLLTILLVSLLWYVKVDIMQGESRLNSQSFYLFLYYR